MGYYKDLSYLKSKDGLQLKPGKLIKASRVSKLKQRELGIKKIIDLRTPEEVSLRPEKVANNVIYKNIPMFDMRVTGVTYERNTFFNELNNINTIEETYKQMVTNKKYTNNLSKIIKEIINSNEYPILYHCTVGKDRTGITTFILLSLLGFDKETIIEDYMYISDMNKIKAFLAYESIYLIKRDKELAQRIKNFMLVDERYLKCAIDAINETYGSMDYFISFALNISPKEKEDFKEKVLIKKI